ncbi:hypothetical protein VNO78_11456 [Psophocarpus tetragonolobus]|uniref:Uncharacterized protein n=1 Tax=Psophocarpus tetragonolobus TaxID=3891 RepID=A0AAN9XN70_PSOTE
MATSISAHQIRTTHNPITFSQSEIEAAKQLIQLSSGDSEEDHCSSNNSYSCSYSYSNSNSYSYSYSVVQGKPQHNNLHSAPDFSSVADSQDQTFARTTKRYRCIQDLYTVTSPLPAAKSHFKRNNFLSR